MTKETLRILDDVIIIFVHANPDGHDLVADWYMREKDPQEAKSLAGLPRLYQKYIGHDNNRDFYANTQAETKNLNRLMYREWFPQLMFDHHQTGPAGTVLFCAPFRDPFNYFCDPLVINGIDAVGRGDGRSDSWSKENREPPSGPKGHPALDVVQRRHPHHDVVPQHHRRDHGDDRQPHADPDPARGREAVAQGGLPRPDRAAGLASPPVRGLLGDGRQGGSRLRFAAPRAAPAQHLAHGPQRDRAGQSRQLDDHAQGRRGRPGRP